MKRNPALNCKYPLLNILVNYRLRYWLIVSLLLLLVGTADAASVANLSFTPGRRWCTAAINVTITTTTVGASIRYTTDGSAPSSTHGTLYTGGLAISATTVLRAVGYMDNGGLDPTAPETPTYLFLDDVIRQGDTAGYGGMDQTIVDDPVWSTTIRSDLQSVPTVSIAMDNADLF